MPPAAGSEAHEALPSGGRVSGGVSEGQEDVHCAGSSPNLRLLRGTRHGGQLRVTWSGVGLYLAGVVSGLLLNTMLPLHYGDWWARTRKRQDAARFFYRKAEV